MVWTLVEDIPGRGVLKKVSVVYSDISLSLPCRWTHGHGLGSGICGRLPRLLVLFFSGNQREVGRTDVVVVRMAGE